MNLCKGAHPESWKSSLKTENQSTAFSSRLVIGRRCGINRHAIIAGDWLPRLDFQRFVQTLNINKQGFCMVECSVGKECVSEVEKPSFKLPY